ncbi:ADP-ribosyl-(Dinitrogen reductase) glycohydrolase [Petrocella atlantisensis]|uniref:ADP-ribosyl-(Dinitrogen reductase) glycohydrolase n=2 Tax=Petrocella atlantisensis TaxID=2173034 RepID=A0A3P7Q1N9_9FIRM|nr:ADP-ribosyl-(Dinitrogen reductase) glycohydrolase [Petrocella atlantisensis]
MEKLDRIKGCMIGGAIGDAFGWPVEFLSYDQIRNKYGKGGIRNLQINSHGVAEITDDTQMSLFTAEGLLRAETRQLRKGICHAPSVVNNAYLRWLRTQSYPEIPDKDWIYDGWLIQHEGLFNQRAPGNTCLHALSIDRMGTIQEPLNDSKGCGGVMRVAPIGLFLEPDMAFGMAMECAALTHGHPTGYIASGALAYLIALLVRGNRLEDAAVDTVKKLETVKDHEETSRALKKAIKLSKTNRSSLKCIQELGEGWIAEEALAIAVYCALKSEDDFEAAMIMSVNHDGDSDSTGAIAGNVLGVYGGIDFIPVEMVSKVELAQVIFEMAVDLDRGHQDTEEWWEKYPGY